MTSLSEIISWPCNKDACFFCKHKKVNFPKHFVKMKLQNYVHNQSHCTLIVTKKDDLTQFRIYDKSMHKIHFDYPFI